MNAGISDVLEQFSPIGLEEMDSIKLMNRIDTKYLTTESTLLLILADAHKAGYRVLEADGAKISPYSSIYYDTPSLRMFYDHRNRRLVRQKVRTRVYTNSGQAFLEIKRKNNKGRTRKKRISIPVSEMLDFKTDREACDYLEAKSWFRAEDIFPVLETAFSRITLVNEQKTERLTIDTKLNFRNFRTGKKASLGEAVIIELKQDGRSASAMKQILLGHRVKPVRVSKYCVALTLTDPSARAGRFRLKIRAIEKTTGKKITTI